VAKPPRRKPLQMRAGDGIRTHDNDVGNVVLYQLSYTRADGVPYAVLKHSPRTLIPIGSTDYRFE
jgi:hypothetical protein